MRRDVCPKGQSLSDAGKNRFCLSRRRCLCWRIARAERYVTHISELPEEPPWYYRTRTRDKVAATWEALRSPGPKRDSVLLFCAFLSLLVLLGGFFGFFAAGDGDFGVLVDCEAVLGGERGGCGEFVFVFAEVGVRGER